MAVEGRFMGSYVYTGGCVHKFRVLLWALLLGVHIRALNLKKLLGRPKLSQSTSLATLLSMIDILRHPMHTILA